VVKIGLTRTVKINLCSSVCTATQKVQCSDYSLAAFFLSLQCLKLNCVLVRSLGWTMEGGGSLHCSKREEKHMGDIDILTCMD
jgi:hypothetical protein